MRIENVKTISTTIVIECSIQFDNYTQEVRKLISLSPGEAQDLINELQIQIKRARKNREAQCKEWVKE